MQHSKIFVVGLLFSYNAWATHNVFNAPARVDQGPVANIQMSADPHQDNSTTLTVNNSVEQRAFIDFTSIVASIRSLPFDAAMQASQRWYHESSSFIIRHKVKIGIGAIIAGYGCFHYTMFMLHSFFNDSQRWANWGPLIEVEDLLTLQPEHLEEELLLEIQRKYINQTNPTDFITPLITFLTEIEYEQLQAQRYLTIAKWLERLHVSYYLPFSLKTDQIRLQAQRLAHIKHTFHNWAAHHKIALTKKELIVKRNKQFPQPSFITNWLECSRKMFNAINQN